MDKNYTIYKLVCKDLDITYSYVGSTSNFTRRKSEHKRVYNNENSKKYNLKVYETIRTNGNWDNWDMIMIEELTCSKLQAHTRERYWVEQLDAKLNIVVPTQTRKEYRETHKQERKIYDVEYQQLNRNRINECRRIRYQNKLIRSLQVMKI